MCVFYKNLQNARVFPIDISFGVVVVCTNGWSDGLDEMPVLFLLLVVVQGGSAAWTGRERKRITSIVNDEMMEWLARTVSRLTVYGFAGRVRPMFVRVGRPVSHPWSVCPSNLWHRCSNWFCSRTCTCIAGTLVCRMNEEKNQFERLVKQAESERERETKSDVSGCQLRTWPSVCITAMVDGNLLLEVGLRPLVVSRLLRRPAKFVRRKSSARKMSKIEHPQSMHTIQGYDILRWLEVQRYHPCCLNE